MMPLDPPSPGSPAGLTEQGDEIEIGVAVRSLVLKVVKDLFEAHDGRGFDIPALAQAAAEQCLGEQALGGSHFAERKSLARLGNEMPVEPLIVLEFVNRL